MGRRTSGVCWDQSRKRKVLSWQPKSLFNKTPKINYTDEDIEANHSGGLVDKLKIALSQLSKLNIQGVLQGDMLFTNDVSTTNIDGKSYRAFTPNTITYAVPSDSDLAKVIDKAKLGIVFHTTYTGDTIADLKASFGADVSGLKKTNDVWFQDASYRDLSEEQRSPQEILKLFVG